MKVQLVRARSYMGHGFCVDRNNPVVEASEDISQRLLATGLFEAVIDEDVSKGEECGQQRVASEQQAGKSKRKKQEEAAVAPGFEE